MAVAHVSGCPYCIDVHVLERFSAMAFTH
ncbi:hypothetical protein LOK74_00725 [Brevibacillus humidisoli]|nr:hypothetical protein [Brevibacillus humidisoli]UFJ43438.1 hypothetical protein LOK74_00725 [Brevibacillus humidisoli]